MAAAASATATYLRSVYRRVYGMAPAQRNWLLRICLAHHLKELPRDALADLLRAVAAELASIPQAAGHAGLHG